MSFLDGGIQRKLENVFSDNGLELIIKKDYLIAGHSKIQSVEKIRKLIETCGLYSIFSENRSNGDFIFTVCPYRVPDSFTEKKNQECKSIRRPHALVQKHYNWCKKRAINELIAPEREEEEACNLALAIFHSDMRKNPVTTKISRQSKTAVFGMVEEILTRENVKRYIEGYQKWID